ncbi:hypothetical protein BDW69DRAFT_175631 [Aspergillus filifer]
MLANSPYEHPIATVVIGTKRYGIPMYYLENIPQIKRRLWTPGPQAVLDDIDEDIGHTLIHFLYTGQYETLHSGYNLVTEYQRSALAYKTARRYGLLGLEAVARKQIEHFGPLVHLRDVLETARVILQNLPTDEMWFKDYLKEYLASSFNKDKESFQEELNTVIGQKCPDRTILQLGVDILFGHISELEGITERVAEPAPAAEAEAEAEPEPELELDPEPVAEPLSEPEALPEALPEPLSDHESGLEAEAEPEYRSHGPLRVGEFPVIQPAEEVVDVGFPEEDIPIPEPEIPGAPEYTAETPSCWGTPAHPRVCSSRLSQFYFNSAQSPVENSEGPKDLDPTLSGLDRRKDKKKKKKKGTLAVVEVEQPPVDPVD